MTITCPGCDKELLIPDTNPPRVRCRFCKTIFSIEYSEPATISDIHFPFKVKVKRTWKNHKGKIIAGVGVAVAAAVGTALYRNSQNNLSGESGGIQSDAANALPPDLSGVTDSVTAGLQTAGTILANTVAEIAPAIVEETKEMEPAPPKTEVELHLLERLANGEFDGFKGSYFWPNSVYWSTIEDGIPIRWKQGPGTDFFNGKENEHIPGKTKVYKRFLTDDEKLEFFRKYGREMPDQEVQDYYWNNWEKMYRY